MHQLCKKNEEITNAEALSVYIYIKLDIYWLEKSHRTEVNSKILYYLYPTVKS